MRNKAVLAMISLLLIVLPAIAQEGMPPAPELTGDIVADGLNGPQGLFVDADGTLWIADSGFGGDEEIEAVDPMTYEVITATLGETSRILRLAADGEPEVIATLPSVAVGQDFVGAARVTMLEDELYATLGLWHLSSGEEVTIPMHASVIRFDDENLPVAVGNLWAHELANNPDATTNVESHPFGITAGPDGNLYVADAAANAVIRVNPETGDTETVVALDGLPGVFPSATRNNELLTDPVPTAVAFDEAGNMYISLLSGAPFVPGSAKVLQVTDEGEVIDFATGMTMLTDLQYGPDGNLYAVSFGMFTEEGPVFNSGSVLRILEDGTAEVVIEGLPFATALAFDADGNGYVAINGLAIPEAGMVVYYDGLTTMEGTPLPAAATQG